MAAAQQTTLPMIIAAGGPFVAPLPIKNTSRSAETKTVAIVTPDMGLLDDPPNLDELDWMQIKRELHNLLVKRAIISIDSSAEMKNLSNTIVSVVQPKIVALLRQKKDFTNGGKK